MLLVLLACAAPVVCGPGTDLVDGVCQAAPPPECPPPEPCPEPPACPDPIACGDGTQLTDGVCTPAPPPPPTTLQELAPPPVSDWDSCMLSCLTHPTAHSCEDHCVLWRVADPDYP
jgi:hypothetical protein